MVFAWTVIAVYPGCACRGPSHAIDLDNEGERKGGKGGATDESGEEGKKGEGWDERGKGVKGGREGGMGKEGKRGEGVGISEREKG